ncbi:MAG: molybdopterin-dependent oxidoreductase, partial [Thaumarchaeota archaeon]|nr:molybdopterin-dependent oxidoreductase [Nitrososphaerota archaeon]
MDPPERNTSVEKTVRTVCDPNCHAAPRCGILAHVKDGKIQRIEPAEFPLQEYSKRICLMGTTRLEYVYHKDRLKFPFKREGPRGQGSWKRISWEEAYKIISNGLRQVAEKYGPEAVYFYQGSGCQGVLTQSSPVRFASVFGGTTRAFGGVDYGVPKGLEYMFGVSAQTFFKAGGHEWADCLNSKMILLWGFNAAETQIVDYRFIQEAQKLGCKIVYVDPNRTITAKKADEWISPRGGSDCALALSMMHTIISRRLLDTSFLLNHTSAPLLVKQDNGRLLCNSELNEKNSKGEYVVFDEKTSQVIPANQSTQPSLSGQFSVTSRGGDEINCTTVFTRLEEVASSYTKEKAEAITQVPASTIEKFAVEYATTKPAAIRVGYGVDRWYYSDLLARALGSLASLTGNIGIPGGGISVRSGTYNIPINISHFKYPAGKPKTLDQIEAFNAILTGKPFPVKALWLQSSNIFNQPAANRKKVVDTLIPQIDFMVVTDHFMTTTAQFADIVLPAASMFEKTDLVAGVFLQLQQKAIPPLGESKSDFDIFKRLAEKMGYSELFAR